MGEWRPIEEAPRDGTRFVGVSEVYGYQSIGHYNPRGEFEQTDRYGEPMGVGFYPTHWMPLPPPPKETA